MELGSGVGIGEWWESRSTVRGLKSGAEMVEQCGTRERSEDRKVVRGTEYRWWGTEE